MSEERTGPDLDSLRRLKGMLPSMIKGIEEQRIGGGGIATATNRPTKMCVVCAAMFDYKTTVDPSIEKGICDPCWKQLQDGCAALVCGDRFAFLKSSNLDDMAGKIVWVSESEFAQVQKQFNLQTRVKEKQTPNPSEA